jgi:hypothetical protein
MKNEYQKPEVKVAYSNLEQVAADSGCLDCCPYDRDYYSRSLCPVAPKCSRSHTTDPSTGKVIASSCPKFNLGYVVD